jgi:outer membrane protein OmpA-like peptidoglycan-associated protein
VRAQELAQQVEALQTAETDRGLVLTLGSVLFESGKANLRSGAQRTVERVAEFLNEYPDRSILVEGFTDSEGSESYNRDLSKRRAQAVRDLLVRHGVDGSRVETEGYGEQFPVANNATAEGRQQNRRVEIVVGKTDGGEILDRTTMR